MLTLSSDNAAKKHPNRLIHLLTNLIATLTGLYAIFVIPPLLIDLLFGEGWIPIALYNTFAPLLWLPALILLPLMIFWRRWRLVALMCIPVLAFSLTFGNRFLPQPSLIDQYPQDDTFTVMTYNLLASNGELV